MARQMLAAVGLAFVAAACSGSGTEPSTTVASSTVPSVTTSTVATVVSFDVPRIGSMLGNEPLAIQVVEDAVLRVDGPCVTAQTDDKTLLLIFDPIGATVLGDEVRVEDWDPNTPTLMVLSSGSRYQFRGVPDPFEAELAEPLPPGCEYDERLILLGALDSPVGHGLRTRPLEFWEGVPAIGINSTTITVDGACTTISYPTGELLVIWPAGTVSLLDDHTIHMSRWEVLGEVVVRSGDTVGLMGAVADIHPDDPPANCAYDGTFFANDIRPVSDFDVAP